jgi:hypothetical protein
MLFIKSISMLYYNIYIIILLVFSDFIKRDIYSIILYRASLFPGTALFVCRIRDLWQGMKADPMHFRAPLPDFCRAQPASVASRSRSKYVWLLSGFAEAWLLITICALLCLLLT